MKRFLLFLLVATMFASCIIDEMHDAAIDIETPETLTVSFDEESRIQLREGKTVWTNGDLVSVFYRSNANQKWQYKGETGERVAELYRVDDGAATATTNSVVVVYPYDADYIYSLNTGNIEANLPATQHYLKNSYGVGDNLMVAQSEFSQFSLKNVCGWLKIQLKGGGESVKSITLKGNNNEQVAGLVYIDTTTATAILGSQEGGADGDDTVGGNLVFEDSIHRIVKLDCGKGVALGTSALAFYITLPPQTFEKGLTIEIEAVDGTTMTKSTSNAVNIERNVVQPMSTFTYEGVMPDIFEIAYATNDEKPLDPMTTEGFGANFVDNVYDVTTGKGALKFDAKITAIPQKAFLSCINLTSIDIPVGVTTIGDQAFDGCYALGAIHLPQGVTKIDNYAFDDCSGLVDVTIPNSVTKIGNYAFQNCSSISEITIPASVTSFGTCPFKGCGANDSKVYVNCKVSSSYYGSVISYFSYSNFTEAILVDGIKVIAPQVFLGCSKLKSVTIPDSVTTISEETFKGCSGLESITIPDSVTTIKDYAFQNCSALKSIKLPNNITTLESCVFSGCKKIASITIPDSVTTIGIGAFKSCKGLKTLTIPKLVTKIGKEAFSGCTGLTGVTIGRSVTVIGNSAFAGCTNLTDLTIGNSVTDIGGSAFSGCTSLVDVTIPYGVIYITKEAFQNCTALKNVAIPESVTSIGSSAFKGCTSLEGLIIPDGITEISEGVFYGCSKLTSVTIPESVTQIGRDSFRNCSSIADITLPKGTKSIALYAFCGCSSLTSFTIPEKVTKIEDATFCKCTSLKSVTIPDGVTTIGYFAFDGCSSLTRVTIPAGVTAIQSYAFRDCISLTRVDCKPTTPPTGNEDMFTNNASDRIINVPTESVSAYKAKSYWKNYASYIVGYDF